MSKNAQHPPHNFLLNNMPCKCGSYNHRRTTNKNCPLNPANRCSTPALSSPAAPVAPALPASPNKSSSKLKSWTISSSFKDKYPALHAEASKLSPKGSTLKKLLKKIISPLVGGGDVHKFTSTVCESFSGLINDFRENERLPEIAVPTEDVANEITGAVLGGMEMPLAKEIAAEMPVYEFDPRLSLEDSIQQCYNTTETPAFEKALSEVLMYPQAMLYAIQMYKKTKTSENVKKFLLEFSKQLYFRHMKNAEINITFH